MQAATYGMTYLPVFLVLISLFDYTTDATIAQSLCSSIGVRASDTLCELHAVWYTTVFTGLSAVLCVWIM